MTHPKTLRTQEDVRALDLGKETTAKVAEIVETGTLARNRALEVDPIAKVVLKVMQHSQGLDSIAPRG